MGKEIYEKTIKNLSGFFESNLDSDFSDSEIFIPLKNIIDFDDGFIFFLNPDNIYLKYVYSASDKFVVDKVWKTDETLKLLLFSQTDEIINVSHQLIKLLGLNDKKSFLLSKLVIKNNVYGFLLLAKKEKDFYIQDQLDVLRAICSVLSYKIKDAELSEIFKIQLSALKDNYVEIRSNNMTIKEQNLKILEADRIKNEFLANISHELRTPLNAIISCSEMLGAKLFGELNDKQAEYVNDINIAGINLLGMINELLDISKLEAKAMTLNKSEFLISRAVSEVVNVLEPLAVKKSISLSEKLNKDGLIYADFQKIKQILYNLLSNAIKFTGKNGKVSVEVSLNSDNMKIIVSDNGIGIAKKDSKRIFDKFVQLENAYTKTESSTGLGLTITNEFVEMHGGKILVESELKKGSKFVINIPLKNKSTVKIF